MPNWRALPLFLRSHLWFPRGVVGERISKHAKAKRQPRDWRERRKARRKMSAASRRRNRE